MAKLRVLVVEDSLTVRKRLVAALTEDREVEVIAEATDGKQALELCQRLRPDVITIDMVLPVMSGLAATEYIMAYCPTPILVVSASANRGAVFKTFEALDAGAVDVLEKPRVDEAEDDWNRRLRESVRMVSRIRVVSHLRAKLERGAPSADDVAPVFPAPAPARDARLVAIGASTGGPSAIVEVLRKLPSDYPLPILLVIHLNQMFGFGFGEWLNTESPIPVRAPKDGEPLPPPGQPCVLFAPPDQHLVIRDGRLRLTQDPERHSCRPSVDSLFESVAKTMGPHAVACLLTGMGRDGAQGLLDIKRAGGLTFAQDEASSVVYGMPREAALLGAASQVLPLGGFAPMLLRVAQQSVGGRKP